jgi:hypothetical protein
VNSFQDFRLTGANAARYLPIFGDAPGIIGAYRKYAEPHKKHEPPPLGIGQTPLFLLDGKLSAATLRRAEEKLKLTVFVAVYRPFDVKLKRQAQSLYKKLRGWGWIGKDGAAADWVLEDKLRAESTTDEYAGERTAVIQPYLDYIKAWEEYAVSDAMPPVDAVTGETIIGDLNDYLYRRAIAIYPLGVESILSANTKQSAIPKARFFVDGMEGAPAPKGVRKIGGDGGQIDLFDVGRPSINDAIEELRRFCRESIDRDGAVRLADIILHCAGIGLYKGNVTLYAIGAACRSFLQENGIFFDGCAYWCYTEVRDVSGWILLMYGNIERGRISAHRKAAWFFDDTGLKQRLERIFGIEPEHGDKRLDTLGMAVVRVIRWIADNLRYPIAFLDGMLFCLLNARELYGEKLRRFDVYFTGERCEWLRERIPFADDLARQAIKAAVGYDPDTTTHVFSNLPKGHYASALYSADLYISEMKRGPVIR